MVRGVIGYKVPSYLSKCHLRVFYRCFNKFLFCVLVEVMGDKLTSLVLKVAQELAYCYPGNKVMIFTIDNEGQDNEQVDFQMIEVAEE